MVKPHLPRTGPPFLVDGGHRRGFPWQICVFAPSFGPVNPTSSAGPSPSVFRRNRGKLLLIGFLLVGAAVTALWTAVTMSFNYSDGDRVGYVQKFSRKGWICPTWEGELAMSPVPGATPQIFPFTVRDDGVAVRITAAEGKKVALHYEEKRGVPSSCFGDTSHFITDVRVLGP